MLKKFKKLKLINIRYTERKKNVKVLLKKIFFFDFYTIFTVTKKLDCNDETYISVKYISLIAKV